MNKHPSSLKKRARQLRISGVSVKRIARIVGISSSTASLWLRDIPMSRQRQLSVKKNATKRLKQATQIKIANTYVQAEKLRDEAFKIWIDKRTDPLFILGIGLYWGEGFKRGGRFGIVNSDGILIRVWMRWCQKFVPTLPLRADIYGYGNEEKSVRYWKKITGLERIKYYTKSKIPGKRPKHLLPYGTIRIIGGIGNSQIHIKMCEWIRLAGQEVKYSGAHGCDARL